MSKDTTNRQQDERREQKEKERILELTERASKGDEKAEKVLMMEIMLTLLRIQNPDVPVSKLFYKVLKDYESEYGEEGIEELIEYASKYLNDY